MKKIVGTQYGMLSQGFAAWTLAVLLLACCSLVSGQVVCGDGTVDVGEMCDDNNLLDGDGCSAACAVEDHWECTHTSTTPSDCVAILLDLNSFDTSSLDRSFDYFDLNVLVFLADPNSLEYFISPAGNWTYLDAVILEATPTIVERVEVDITAAQNDGRDVQNTVVLFVTDITSSHYPLGVNGMTVSSGERIVGDFFDGDSALTPEELQTALLSVVYVASSHPGFSPREVCLVAVDPLYSTTACVTLYFIGRNSNHPTITYVPVGVASFTEGQTEAVAIVDGTITVQDDDHPTRYLMQSAAASIVGFSAGQEEWLSLNTSFTLPADLSYTFDSVTGTLTITGSATTDVYSTVLHELIYFNNMTEPAGLSRSIELTVTDEDFTSMPATITINIINTNDNPLVSLNGETPVIITYSTSYTEGSGAVAVVPDLYVVDSDPSPVIVRANVTLTNPVDDSAEQLNVTDPMGLSLISTLHSLELSGPASPAEYSAVLRTLTYEHLSANPGHPSTDVRVLSFTVEDDQTATSLTSTLSISIIQVNDAPILSYEGGGSVDTYNYTEDDLAISIGQKIQLMDIDSLIVSASLSLTNLLDGSRDSIGYDSSLLAAYSITANITDTDGGGSREVVFDGVATDAQYAEILKSLTYVNLHTDNAVTNGERNITITTTDTGSLSSNTLTLLINVAERNDGPAIDLGDGDNAGFSVAYTENGPGVAIGLTHLIQVMDEEGHNVSSMIIELVSENGELDDGESLFLRTPMALPFIFDPNTIITNTLINVSLTSESAAYARLLQAVRYTNTELEPTLFVNGSSLTREIVIRITDASTVPVPTTNEVRVSVQIEPINDNAPRIIINSDPVCTEDCRDSGDMKTISRRSATPLRGTLRRRRRSTAHGNSANSGATPQVVWIEPSFISTGNSSCLSTMTVLFNTDTSAPPVEIQQELDSLLTFAPASLAKTPHYGYWADYRTLVIVFRECARWEEEGEGHSKKPLYVIFYGEEGLCDWESPCNKGVCYYNVTGCPVAGYHHVGHSMRGTSSESDMVLYVPADISRHVLILLSAIVFIAFATVLAAEWILNRRRSTSQATCDDKEMSLEIKPTSSHVIDIHIPAVDMSTTKSPPPPTDTVLTPQLAQKVPALGKDEHLPPPYSQGEENDFVSNKKPPERAEEKTPSKQRSLKRASPRRLCPSNKKESWKSAENDATGEEEEEGENEGGYMGNIEGRGEGEGEGVGNGTVLRGGAGDYMPAQDGAETLRASSSSCAEDDWRVRGRGSTVRTQGHLGKSPGSREQSQQSHSHHKHHNDSAQHPH